MAITGRESELTISGFDGRVSKTQFQAARFLAGDDGRDLKLPYMQLGAISLKGFLKSDICCNLQGTIHGTRRVTKVRNTSFTLASHLFSIRLIDVINVSLWSTGTKASTVQPKL